MYSINKENLEENKAKLHSKAVNERLRLCTFAIGGALLCVLIALSVINVNQAVENGKKGYSIMVNDQAIALLQNADDAQKAINNYIAKETKAVDQDVYTRERLDIAEDKLAEEGSFKSVDEATTILAASVTPIVNAAVISIDGKKQVTVGSAKVASSVLDKVKKHYVPNDDTLKVIDVKFRSDVDVDCAWVSADKVMTSDEASSYLVNGTNDTVATHKVADGENAWVISRACGITTSQLAAANPGVNMDKLKIGQNLKLVSSQSLIEVAAVLQKVAVNAIPYKTVYTKDRSAAAGSQTVTQKGKNGKEEVTLQLVRVNGNEVARSRVNTVVLEEAVAKKVTKGTAITMASRSGDSGGSGDLLWPTCATRISSYYGNRSRGFHTGLDIDGNIGDSVWAADSGTVTLAGWDGSYGYCIMINHGNGMTTRYGHLSRIEVSVGQSVSRGETIGLEGSTGNSTGSHLHFEVIIGGSTRNPLPYLR